jgi:hypothetical protein
MSDNVDNCSRETSPVYDFLAQLSECSSESLLHKIDVESARKRSIFNIVLRTLRRLKYDVASSGTTRSSS